MNIKKLLYLMATGLAYQAAVAANMPFKLQANAADMFTAANGNTQVKSELVADQFLNNRNEMMYDYTPSVGAAAMATLEDAAPASTVAYMYKTSAGRMVAMASSQSFVSNMLAATQSVANGPTTSVSSDATDYRYEDVPDTEILRDTSADNVIMFVPRHRLHRHRA